MRERKSTDPKILFEKKVIKADGCWKWTASVNDSTGQGIFAIKNKVMNAHRAAWTLYRGEIPEGKLVHHSCGNKLCVNPDHLEIVDYGYRRKNN